MIRVAFRYGDKSRIFSRFVCLVQGGDCAHTEISMRCVADVHECVSASWLDGGVRVKTMRLPADKWRIYRIDGDPDAAMAWAVAHAGEGYDLLGLLGFVFRRIKGWAKLWWCSECNADIIGLQDSWRYDPALLESVVAHTGVREQ